MQISKLKPEDRFYYKGDSTTAEGEWEMEFIEGNEWWHCSGPPDGEIVKFGPNVEVDPLP
tara:strand:- start:141 stop:320 length:180 start_codon:yes stop_codon:yes gene_type:complete